MGAGTAAGDALLQPLISRPGLFFVGFMLTEPLTLPPRRWQQLSLAAVVGVLFAVPFHIGPLYHSPELALLIGNALAFLAGQRRGLALTFPGAREPDAHQLRIPLKPCLARPLPRRPVQRLPEPPATASTFKRSLNALRPGERIRATRIGGDFALPPGPEPLLRLAGGVGITPFMSQQRDLVMVAADRDVVLVYAVSTPEELGYRQELKVLASSMPNLRLLVLGSEAA